MRCSSYMCSGQARLPVNDEKRFLDELSPRGSGFAGFSRGCRAYSTRCLADSTSLRRSCALAMLLIRAAALRCVGNGRCFGL
eukprot:1424029-Pleurochrysis_carterae.AAC.2